MCVSFRQPDGKQPVRHLAARLQRRMRLDATQRCASYPVDMSLLHVVTVAACCRCPVASVVASVAAVSAKTYGRVVDGLTDNHSYAFWMILTEFTGVVRVTVYGGGRGVKRAHTN